MPYIFKTVIASGTLAAGNAKLSMVDTAAFADSVGINLAQYVDGKAMLYLRNTTGGYEAFALLSAVGTGETTANIWSDDCADDGTGDWSKANCTAAFDTDHYVLTYVSASQYLYKSTGTIGAGKLVKASADFQNGSLSGVSVDVQTNQGLGSNLIICATGTTSAGYATVSGYKTVGTQSTVAVHAQMGGAGNVLVKNIAFLQVLTPSTSGVTLKNLAGAQSFIFKHASFNPNAEMLWRVVTDKKIYRIL